MVLPVIGSTTTGIATIAATLMVGSTVALGFLSLELALVSAGVDAIEIAATLQNAFQAENPADSTYDAERWRFLDGLAKDCADAGGK